ncbi:MAG TPA: DNA polymerase III subunit delta' [Bacillales bacterium]|nr:DNA polymerase III subunit delta' [Bacillales bacterium]
MSWETLRNKQPNVVRILTNSFLKNRLAHAYLFEGGKGTGKIEAAFLFAKRYFCESPEGVEPCNACGNCRRIDSGNHPDVHVIQPDGQSIKKGQIQDLIKEFSYRGVESRRKVYLLKHADKMTTQAANSLLKFLEEPGKMTVALLLTEQAQQMLPTILSRCQMLSFSALTPSVLEAELSEEDSEALRKAAVALTNDVEEAKAMCTDGWFAQARTMVVQLTEELRRHPYEAFLFLEDKWHAHFQDKTQLATGLDFLLLWYRDVLLVQLEQLADVVFVDYKNQLEEEALSSFVERTERQMTAVLEARRRLDANVHSHSVMEQLVWKLQGGSTHAKI